MIQNSGQNNGANHPLTEHQWKPGQSGNPNGRPKTDSITLAIRRLMAQGVDGQPLYDAIARVAVQKALRGDHRFWTYVIERCDGKVADALQQSGAVEVVVRYEDQVPERD
tara:strand:- start:362 stop:691 length:330 start_codon:yes stop_codon:yes gene_type:complete